MFLLKNSDCNGLVCNGKGVLDLFRDGKETAEALATETGTPLDHVMEELGLTLPQLRETYCGGGETGRYAACPGFQALASADPHQIARYKR